MADWLLERAPLRVQAAWQNSPRALAAVALLVVSLCAGLAGRWIWQAQHSGSVLASVPASIPARSAGAEPVPVPVGGAGPSPGGGLSGLPGAGPSLSGPSPSTAAGSVLVVHVVGEVVHPGVVEVEPGSRVLDAITAAGGTTARADPAPVNLARLLVDGEQILMPRRGQVMPGPGMAGPGSGGTGSAGTGQGSGSGIGPGALVSLNTAPLAGLDSLPGIGPVLAQRILDWRTAHGRFTQLEELGEIEGIGPKLLARLRPLVTL